MYKTLWLLLVLVAATRTARLPYIEGGQDVEPVGKWPWQGLVEFLGSPYCGCVVLSADWMLTIASSFVVPSFMTVLLGAHDIDTKTMGKPSRYLIAEVIKHPDYPADFDILYANDIGLIRLLFPADLSSAYIGAAALVPADSTEAFTDCYMTGWGATWDGDVGPDSLHHNVLQEGKVSLITNEACTAAWADAREKPGPILDTNICVTGSASGLCVTDNGGPVVCSSNGTWLVVGVMSYASEFCSEDYPTICTRVSRYREWIDEATNGDIPIA